MVSLDLTLMIGRQITAARLQNSRLTPQLTADFLGISLQHYQQIEAGAARPTAEQIVLLADLMGVKPSCFFEGLGKPT